MTATYVLHNLLIPYTYTDCLQIIKEKMNVTVSANNINVSTVTTNTPHTTTTTTATATTVTGICAASNSQQSNAPDRKCKEM